MKWLALMVTMASALVACDAFSPSAEASRRYPSFRYELALGSDVFAVGEPLRLRWEPHRYEGFTNGIANVTLCFALFGPFPDAASAKDASSADRDPPACPPTGAAVASDVVPTTSAVGATLNASAPAPQQPGFYDLREIQIGTLSVGSTQTQGQTVVHHRIVEVRAR